jgi:hypothetical protein
MVGKYSEYNAPRPATTSQPLPTMAAAAAEPDPALNWMIMVDNFLNFASA